MQTESYQTPTWVKTFGIIALVLAIVVAIMLMTGEHGPGRHNSLGTETTEQSGQ
jgi:hypothetical protein